MTTVFPVALDAFNNPAPTDQLGSSFVPHHQQHTDANDAIEALQRSVGIDGSTDPDSIQFRLGAVESPGPFYGSFYNDVDITFAANVPKAIPFPLVVAAAGISVGTPDTRIVIANGGVYSIAVNMQLLSTTPNLVQVFIWLRRNGVDIPNSVSQLSLTDTNYAIVAAWTYFGNAADGDYIEIIVASDNAAVTLDADIAQTVPYVRPAGVSALISLRQVDR